MIKLKYSYFDNENEETSLTKTFAVLEEQPKIDRLISEFFAFLILLGYDEKQIVNSFNENINI